MVMFNSQTKWLVAGLLAVSGCAMAPHAGSELVSQLDVQDSAKPAELSPAVASNACVATAKALAKNGYETDAIAEYEHARELNPEVTGISRYLAVLYGRQHNRQKALTEFQLALKEHPKDADLLNDFGYFHLEQEEWSLAETQLNKALTLAPKHERARINLGLALAYQGRVEESLAAFKPAIGEAAAHSNLAMILAQQGKADAARREFQRAAELDATLQQPQVALAILDRETEVGTATP
ncbi:MAG: repeat-containing protein [Planctomycetaceae bacterium]|nr:repeat-containing protein [Planctomycetaceae bacterium]